MKNTENQKKYNIFFTGRLEEEKGIDILLEIIKETKNHQLPYCYHIFGYGSYFSYFSNFDENFVKLYGKVSPEVIWQKFSTENADCVLMPSKFLETFGLAGLEALAHNVPVIGFRKGGLQDFILPEFALDEQNPVESFFEILQKGNFSIPDISRFSYENWQKNLQELTKGFQKILLIHDYEEKIGGAEIYLHTLRDELQKIGKMVEIFAYNGEISPFERKKLFLQSLFSLQNEKMLTQKIHDFQPDLLWSQTILRNVGVSGMSAIQKSQLPHFMTHHDFGLFSVRPSKIHQISEIPENFRLGKWFFVCKNFSDYIISFVKWLIISRIWKKIPQNTLHIVPSFFMKNILEKYGLEKVFVFPHTMFKNK